LSGPIWYNLFENLTTAATSSDIIKLEHMTAKTKHTRNRNKFCKDFSDLPQLPDEIVNETRNEMLSTVRIVHNFCPLSQCVFAHVRTKQIFKVNIANSLHVSVILSKYNVPFVH